MIVNSLSNNSVYCKKRNIPFENVNISSESDKSRFSGFETVLFNKQLTHIIHCPITAKGSYIIPDSVFSIGIEAFSQCKGLTSIKIPVTLKTIGCLAFENCCSLTSVTLPASVEEIGFRCFSNCKNLKSIYIQGKTPIKLGHDSEVFYKVDKTNCILYVPIDTKIYFMRALQWKEFNNIVEIEYF
jgi:hypothetical protein